MYPGRIQNSNGKRVSSPCPARSFSRDERLARAVGRSRSHGPAGRSVSMNSSTAAPSTRPTGNAPLRERARARISLPTPLPLAATPPHGPCLTARTALGITQVRAEIEQVLEEQLARGKSAGDISAAECDTAIANKVDRSYNSNIEGDKNKPRIQYKENKDKLNKNSESHKWISHPNGKRSCTGHANAEPEQFEDKDDVETVSTYPVRPIKKRRKVSKTPQIHPKTQEPEPETIKHRLAKNNKDGQIIGHHRQSLPNDFIDPPRSVVKKLQSKFRTSIRGSASLQLNNLNHGEQKDPVGIQAFDKFVSGNQNHQPIDSDLKPAHTSSASTGLFSTLAQASDGEDAIDSDGVEETVYAEKRTNTEPPYPGNSSPPYRQDTVTRSDFVLVSEQLSTDNAQHHGSNADAMISEPIFTSPMKSRLPPSPTFPFSHQSNLQGKIFQKIEQLKTMYRFACETTNDKHKRLESEVKNLKNENIALQNELASKVALLHCTMRDNEYITKCYLSLIAENENLGALRAVMKMAESIFEEGDRIMAGQAFLWANIEEDFKFKFKETIIHLARLINVMDLIKRYYQNPFPVDETELPIEQARTLVRTFLAEGFGANIFPMPMGTDEAQSNPTHQA